MKNIFAGFFLMAFCSVKTSAQCSLDGSFTYSETGMPGTVMFTPGSAGPCHKRWTGAEKLLIVYGQ
jgi:hypothetical protein